MKASRQTRTGRNSAMRACAGRRVIAVKHFKKKLSSSRPATNAEDKILVNENACQASRSHGKTVQQTSKVEIVIMRYQEHETPADAPCNPFAPWADSMPISICLAYKSV